MRRTNKLQAIQLRLQGKSYNEIRKLLGIPSKGTLSYWFKDLRLTPDARRRLAHNIALAWKRGLFRFNRERSRAIRQENALSRGAGRREIGNLSRRELLIAGAALYWGEGTKSEKRTSPLLALSNSDPRLVALFMRFVREVLKVPENRIRSGVHIHPHLSAEKARRFWAKVTGLSADNFYVVAQVSRASKSRRPRNSLPYGTVSVRVSNRALFQRVLGYIEGLADNAIRLGQT